MSWISLKKAKTIVYLSGAQRRNFANKYLEMNQMSLADLITFRTPGSKRNKKKDGLNDFIRSSLIDEWAHDKIGFREKYSFVYHADAIEENLYELIWAFCTFNPRYKMMTIRGGIADIPTYIDFNLSVTFKKDFCVSEFYGRRKNKIAESQYRINTDTITLIYGDMMDFRIGFENGSEYRFQTLFDGRKTSGSISTDIGDLQKWKILLQKAEEERLMREKANAPARIITTDEFQKSTLAFAKEACEDFYEKMLDIEQDYERYAMIPNVFVDFSVYKQKWSDLANRTKVRYDEVTDYSLLWDKQPNKDFSATSLYGVMMNQTWSFYHSIYLYCNDMTQMMQHLYEKAHGSKYSMKDYQKELQATQQRRSTIDREYLDVKQRYQNQTRRYQEQMDE